MVFPVFFRMFRSFRLFRILFLVSHIANLIPLVLKSRARINRRRRDEEALLHLFFNHHKSAPLLYCFPRVADCGINDSCDYAVFISAALGNPGIPLAAFTALNIA
jgi:hypothetical protein